jgi:hypothetical protein
MQTFSSALVLAILAPSVASAAASLPDGVVAWWEAEGDPVDSIGPNDGTLVAGAYGEGVVGRAFSFNGTTDFVDVGSDSSLTIGGSDFTYEAWIRTAFTDSPSGTPSQLIIADRNTSATESGFTFYVRSGRMAARMGDGISVARFVDDADATVLVSDDQWHHVAITVDRDEATGATMYVDGEPVASYDPCVASGSVGGVVSTFIGADTSDGGANRFFGGLIDELTFYDRALTADEIASIFDAGEEGKIDDRVGPDPDCDCTASLVTGSSPQSLLTLGLLAAIGRRRATERGVRSR